MKEIFSPFVVFGPSKSGTTWLQKCMDSHPDVSCKFQVPIFPVLNNVNLLFPVQGHRKPILADSKGVFNANRSPFKGVFEGEREEYIYNNQLKLIDVVSRDFWNYMEKNRINDHKHQEEFALTQSIIRDYTETFLRKGTDKKILGTKAYTDLEKFFTVFPTSKVIVIFRDGRDVSVSKRYHHKRQGAYFHGDERNSLLKLINSSDLGRKVSKKILIQKLKLVDESSFKISNEIRLFSDASLEKICLDWKLVSEYLLEWMNIKKENIIPIYYEKLKTDPKSELKKAFKFVGAKINDQELETIIEKNSFSSLKKKQGDSFFRSGKSGGWKDSFTDRDKDLFKELAGEVLINLGYEKNNTW